MVLGGDREPLRVAAATLEIAEGRITAVHEHTSDSPRSPQRELDEDLGGHIVAPAFINAHTHLSMVAFRGLMTHAQLRGNVVEDLFFRLETSLQPQDVRAFTRLGAFECLRHGVGRVWDHYYFGEAVAQGMGDVGLRGVVAPTLQDVAGPGCDQLEAQLQATEALTADHYAARGIHAALGPHATDTVSQTLWQRIAELAERHQLPVHAHVAQSVEEFSRIEAWHGCSPVQWLSRLGVLDTAPSLLAVHAIFVSDDDLERLDPTRHTLGYCPLSQQQFCFPAHVPSWHAAGVPWIVGTDCAVSNDAMNVQRELAAVAGIRGFAPSSGPCYAEFRHRPDAATAQAADAVRISTLDDTHELIAPSNLLARVWSAPGRLHPAFSAGAIEVGAEADLAVFDAEHPALWPARDVLRGLALCDTTSALHGLMLGGHWRIPIGRAHALTRTPEYVEARDEADARLQRLLRGL